VEFRIFGDLTGVVAKALHARLKRGGVFCFPTGRTMDPIYAALVDINRLDPVDGQKIEAFMVDEYWGLTARDPRSYGDYLQQRVYSPLGIRNYHFIRAVGDPSESAAEYEAFIHKAGGVDLQLLGLGKNGHIGFNEPGSSPDSRTRLVEIADSTREANAELFGNIADVPTHAISIGVGTILSAKEVWVIVSGLSKGAIVRKVHASSPTLDIPASHLKGHASCIMFMDEECALRGGLKV
jgi:glucosamine-6-phosphate deaminase